MLYSVLPTNEEDLFISDSGEQEDCNVAGINLHGTLMTYIPDHAEGDTYFDYDTVASENIIGSIEVANDNPNIKAIVIEVSSGGGSVVAGEEIAEAVKNSDKPIFAFVRDIGASSAYWAISSADKIWASENSEVGSIGVTMSYLNNVEKNKKDGLAYEKLSSGKFKDSGSADMPLTTEERDLFMRDIKIMYRNFIKAVSENRNIPIEEIEEISDGSTVLGLRAKELKLIDDIGGINEINQYLEEEIGEEMEICWE